MKKLTTALVISTFLLVGCSTQVTNPTTQTQQNQAKDSATASIQIKPTQQNPENMFDTGEIIDKSSELRTHDYELFNKAISEVMPRICKDQQMKNLNPDNNICILYDINTRGGNPTEMLKKYRDSLTPEAIENNFNTELTGYFTSMPAIVFEQDYTLAYFVVSDFKDTRADIKTEIEQYSKKETSSLDKIGIGCVEKNTITTDMKTDDKTIAAIMKSTAAKPVTVELLKRSPGSDNPCGSIFQEMRIKQ